MNAYKIILEASKLCGIAVIDDNLKVIGLTLVNTVLSELGFLEVKSLNELIGLPSASHRRALISGTAMLIANTLGDSVSRKAFSDDYNRKKAMLKPQKSRIRDVLPKGEWL